MAEYRAYTVGHDGHFTDYKALICQDDREAIEQAKALLDDHTIELWSGDRMVTRVSHVK